MYHTIQKELRRRLLYRARIDFMSQALNHVQVGEKTMQLKKLLSSLRYYADIYELINYPKNPRVGHLDSYFVDQYGETDDYRTEAKQMATFKQNYRDTRDLFLEVFNDEILDDIFNGLVIMSPAEFANKMQHQK